MLRSRGHVFFPPQAFPNNEHGHDHCLRHLDGNRRRLELRFVDYGAAAILSHGWGDMAPGPQRILNGDWLQH